jgi:hypothetical protein
MAPGAENDELPTPTNERLTNDQTPNHQSNARGAEWADDLWFSCLAAYRFVPGYFALYRFANVMKFYLRNNLAMNKLRANGLKNSPPASASARLFATELFFGKEEPGKKYHP